MSTFEDLRSKILPHDDLNPVPRMTASPSIRVPSDRTIERPSAPNFSARLGATSLILPACTRPWKRYGLAGPSSLVCASQNSE